MCDKDCEGRIIADSSVIEAENVILMLVILLLLSMVYVTGLIVWVWCNRNPTNGIARHERKATRLANETKSKPIAMESMPVIGKGGDGSAAAEVIIETRIVPHCTATTTATSIVLRPGSDLKKPDVVVHTIAEV